MMKTHKKIIICFAAFFLLFTMVFNSDAPCSDLGIFAKKKEIKDLINAISSVPGPAKRLWGWRNPFVAPAEPKKVERSMDLRLKGIFLGSDKPSTIINDHVLGVGDTVDQMVVSQINQDNVILVDDQGNQKILFITN